MPWLHHFIVRKESYRTTWKLWLLVIAALTMTYFATRQFMVRSIANALTCIEHVAPSDAILIENFDPDYLLFERAAKLKREGVATRILVPIGMLPKQEKPSAIKTGLAELMAKVALLIDIELLPIREFEPITLNAAEQIREFLKREQMDSVQVVLSGFRSQRSALVYTTVFSEAGIKVNCAPVFDNQPRENWAQSWHGIQEVALQSGKLLYYRLWVLL